MTIRVHDSMRRRVVPLEPRRARRVSMYVCGPTVYDYIHIGNARTFIWFDLIRRYLAYRGFDVTYVMNYTDVDDKIIDRSAEEGVPPEAVALKYARAFEEDMAGLGVEPPDVLGLATEHIDDMVKAIQGLIERGFAYEADGNVFFDVGKFDEYGRLSGRSLDDLRAGERVEPHPAKRQPLDFALWKAARDSEPAWPAPWGPGRPGWHIECSVMSTKYLGMGFDIHGGGSDLLFPHHENERAQAEAGADGQTFVRYWLHTGMVQMETEKMSKSLGNFVTARALLERHPGEVLRLWAVSGSYRSQVTFSPGALEDASQTYARWTSFLQATRHLLGGHLLGERADGAPADDDSGARARFVDAMDDDFNSPAALAAIHDLVREGNRRLDAAQRGDAEAGAALRAAAETFLELTGVLGFGFEGEGGDSALVGGLIEALLDLREQARAERAFERADAIRGRLASLGVVVEDTPSGARWRLGAPPG